ncbi:hypothetical protein HOO54_17750 [Bacillus sp. WMMC1349]|uniref:hypothetical protein n=1 Tax=Bacillus sp. WMMC1349 TaxID=2736254 RepID=UPI001553F42A|nr:hypothetical protein [Bacillus sp. WMMC1349]NPC94012.1 hypothetical protein [Bacillus sp. WMMC1349]
MLKTFLEVSKAMLDEYKQVAYGFFKINDGSNSLTSIQMIKSIRKVNHELNSNKRL